jgi:hypothetical protein
MTDEMVEEPIGTIEPLNIDELSDRKLGEKAAEKPDLNGQEIVIHKIELIPTGQIRKSKDGTRDMETILFKTYYDNDEQWENYGGVNRFIRNDGTKSEPSINPAGKNAAANLFNLWLKYTRKYADEVSYKEFFKSLTGLKAKLGRVTTKYQGKDYFKNVITEFL